MIEVWKDLFFSKLFFSILIFMANSLLHQIPTQGLRSSTVGLYFVNFFLITIVICFRIKLSYLDPFFFLSFLYLIRKIKDNRNILRLQMVNKRVMLQSQTILQHFYKMLMWPTSYWFSFRPTINITFSFSNNYLAHQQFVNSFVK